MDNPEDLAEMVRKARVREREQAEQRRDENLAWQERARAADRKIIVDWFDDFKKHIIDELKAEKIAQPREIPKKQAGSHPTFCITKPNHEYHGLLVEFQRWVESVGLNCDIHVNPASQIFTIRLR